MAEKTAISLELKADEFIDSLDKSASKAEDFGDRCSKAMETIVKNVDKMTKNQKRVYESLKATYEKNVKTIKDMEDEYEKLRAKKKAGEKLTEEEMARLKELKTQYSTASREIANTAKSMEGLISRNKDLKNSMSDGAKKASDFGDMVKIAFGNVMAVAIEKAISLAMDLAKQIAELGLKAEQTVAQLGAMKNNVLGGASAYENLNNVLRNTNWQEETVMSMGKQLMNLGYNASEASEYIQILADASAGLGIGESGATALMQTLNKIKTTTEFTAKDMKSLQQQGIHVEEAFAKAFGVSTQEAMQKIKEGAVDGQQAFEILTNYMQSEFSNSMNASKNNLTDMWGDITGNITTMLGDIGRAIAEGFGKTDIMQGLIDITNEWVEDVRGAINVVKNDFAPLFDLIGYLAGGAFKILVAGINFAISAFKVAYEVAQPFINALMQIFEWANKCFGAIGDLWKRIGKAWKEASAGGYYEGDMGLDLGADADSPSVTGYKGDGTYQFNAGKKGSSGGSKGSASTKNDEDKKARETLNNNLAQIRQRYADINEQTKETRKGQDDLTKASNEYTNNTLKGLDLIKEQNKQKLEQLDTQKTRELENHEAKIKMLDELKAKLEEAQKAGLIDGSDVRLAQIQSQIDQENTLHATRIKNIDELKKKQEELNNQRVKKESETDTAVRSYYKGQAKEFASSMADCIVNAKSFSEAFKNFVKQIIQQLIQAVIYALILSAFGVGGTGSFGGNFMKNFNGGFFGNGKAGGGLVTGAGTSTSDSIPTMLSNGEYVIQASAVNKIGLGALNAINSGFNPMAHMAEGGLVGGSASGGSASTIVLNVSALDANSFGDFLNRGGLKTIKQAMYNDNQDFNSSFGVF